MPPNTVTFTTKGQVVIPAKMREHFQIKPGTRAIVEQTENGILLRPMTAWAIDHLHGIFADPNGPSLLEEYAAHKREEREREERLLGEPALPAAANGEPRRVRRRS